MHVYHLESELLKMVYDLGAMLCLNGVPNIIVNDLVERWILIICTFSMMKFTKTIHVLLTQLKLPSINSMDQT
jgi:hypothetical protein